jgi:hypothetical protein
MYKGVRVEVESFKHDGIGDINIICAWMNGYNIAFKIDIEFKSTWAWGADLTWVTWRTIRDNAAGSALGKI